VPCRSFSGTVKPFYSWLMDNGYGGKPFMLAEYGTIENPATRRPRQTGSPVRQHRWPMANSPT